MTLLPEDENELDVTNMPSNQLCYPNLRVIHDGIADVSIEGDTIDTDETRTAYTEMSDPFFIGCEKKLSKNNNGRRNTNITNKNLHQNHRGH